MAATLKAFVKDSIIYGVAAVLPRVINFLLVRVHTDALPAKNYAENTDFYIWAALFGVLLTFELETTFLLFFVCCIVLFLKLFLQNKSHLST